MRRRHLFEWEDQAWLPAVFRDFITDHLHFGLTQKIRVPINRRIARHLRSLAERAKTRRIVDLCAGAGGPLLKIQRILSEEWNVPITVVLTDLYPNVKAFKQREVEGGEHVTARYESTSAFDVPVELAGVRTLFTSLHHFNPNQVRMILADAAQKRQPIAIFEPLERTLLMTFQIGLFSLYQSFWLTPRVGRLTPKRFLLTYVLPLCPAIMLWDGMVSALRTYTPDELLQIADEVGVNDYEWDAGGFRNRGPLGFYVPTIFLVGLPSVPTAATDPRPIIDSGSTPQRAISELTALTVAASHP